MQASAILGRVLGSRRRRGERLAPFASAVIFHLLLLAMFVSSKPPPIIPSARPIDVSLIAGLGRISVVAPAIVPIEPKPNPVVLKSTVATQAAQNLGSSLLLKPKPELNAPKSLAPVLAAIASGGPSLTAMPISIESTPATAPSMPAQTAGGARCQLLENLKFGLQSNNAVKAALLLIPKKSLSVANAILLWNGRWIDEADVGGAAVLDPIQQAVAQTVSLTPPDCQSELLHGPRFIALGDAHDTMVLAFGSADWRWSDLLATLSPPTL
jgi:hypothetical protein